MSLAVEDVLVACHYCDLLHHMQVLPEDSTARCSRCGAVLYKKKRNSLDRALTLTIAALILYFLAVLCPFMDLKLHGQVRESTLITGVKELFTRGMWSLSALVLLVAIVVPLLKIIGLLYVLIPLKFKRRPWKLAFSYRMLEFLRPWGMLEVYMLGVLVALVKLTALARVELGIAFYSFAALILITTAARASLDSGIIWSHLEPEP